MFVLSGKINLLEMHYQVKFQDNNYLETKNEDGPGEKYRFKCIGDVPFLNWVFGSWTVFILFFCFLPYLYYIYYFMIICYIGFYKSRSRHKKEKQKKPPFLSMEEKSFNIP